MKYHGCRDSDTEPNPGGRSSPGKFREKPEEEAEERKTGAQEIAVT